MVSVRQWWLVACCVLAGCGNDTPGDTARLQCLKTIGEFGTVEGGIFILGSDTGYREEGPARSLALPSFAIQTHEVTNAQFAAFVEETGYITEAELPPPQVGAIAREQAPGAAVFRQPTATSPTWWHWTPGATWRTPEGPGSTIERKQSHPVVQVTLKDAEAYARWAGQAIPTADQWEAAAKNAIKNARYEWGDTLLREDGSPRANIWQGIFPVQNTADDGFIGAAPVGCFQPNTSGLYDMTGNVWELTSTMDESGENPVVKGGSFLCADNYCRRYRPAAWQTQDQGLGTNHIGFRTIARQAP